jgi:guanyl-specific ribonuclease Sa
VDDPRGWDHGAWPMRPQALRPRRVHAFVSSIFNDGSTFMNKVGLLPAQPQGYYREWVHPTPGVSGPGPQRIVTGSGGELFYTPDHYKTFIPLN